MRPLWPHQKRLIELARAQYVAGHRRILCVLPTGGGKTRVAAEMVREMVQGGQRVLWIAHLAELLEQARSAIGLDAVDVESIQSLHRRRSLPHYDAVIVDEAHHSAASTYRAVLQRLTPPLLIGLTATPSRLDGQALGSVFDTLCVGATTSELVSRGILVPSRVVGPATIPAPGTIAGHPVEVYEQRCPGAKALWFCASVDGAACLARQFTSCGYPAASLDGKVSKDERRRINEAFASSELRVLTNARLISEGYDVPNVEVVGFASNMTSPAMLLQAIGRGKRSAPGKTHELVLDLAGVCMSLGIHPDEDLHYSLEGKPITGPGERGDQISRCEWCGLMFRANEFRDCTCPECGHVREGRPDPRVVRAQLEEQKATRLRTLAAHESKERVHVLRTLLATGSLKRARFLFNRQFGYWPSKALIERAQHA